MVVLGGGSVSYERGTPVILWVCGKRGLQADACGAAPQLQPEREFFIDNLLARIHFIIVMIRWTGLASWEFEFPFPGSLTSTFSGGGELFCTVFVTSCDFWGCFSKYEYPQKWTFVPGISPQSGRFYQGPLDGNPPQLSGVGRPEAHNLSDIGEPRS